MFSKFLNYKNILNIYIYIYIYILITKHTSLTLFCTSWQLPSGLSSGPTGAADSTNQDPWPHLTWIWWMEMSSAFHCHFPKSIITVPTFDSSLNFAVAASTIHVFRFTPVLNRVSAPLYSKIGGLGIYNMFSFWHFHKSIFPKKTPLVGQ